MNLAQFRLDFPGFTDTTKYPDSQLTFWSSIGETLISQDLFDTLYTQGVELYTAHNISLAYNQKTGKIKEGLVNAKRVGDVNVGYDTASAIEPNAGHWNLTIYGRQFIHLVRILGAGVIQL